MNGELSPIAKKAYEVSYALFRIAALVNSRSFAELLEYEALQLLRNAIRNSRAEAEAGIQAIGYLVSFGKDTGIVHPENAALIISQLEVLAALAVAGIEAKTGNEPIDLTGVFSEVEIPAKKGAATTSPNPANENAAKRPRPVAASGTNAGAAPLANFSLSPGLKERQEIILQRIRQSGNCRTSDLQAVLPELSERTLRYDLQRLVEQGIIERGGAGPTSWYRMKAQPAVSNVSVGPSL